jgi:ElaB/YqjD/DUF883 family membrane-anchored ribosome-binding protein
MEGNMAQARAASNGGRNTKEDFDSLRADLDTLRQDVGMLVNTLTSTVSGKAEAELDAMRQRFATLVNDLQTTGQQQVRNVESRIQERPFVTLAMAFASGLVVGRLLDRR